MKYKSKYIYFLFVIITLMITNTTYAQYPGGVSSGTTRGYKVDYYNGTFNNQTGFGEGTANATPANTAYSNKITGDEFQPIDGDFYALEYSGTLEITVAGNYTFNITGDDRAWLYIDGNLIAQATPNVAASGSVALSVGDHTIKVKMYELGGANFATLKFGANPAGITVSHDVDGRFVRSDNSKLTAWYKASDVTITPNYGGPGVDKVNSFVNMAPDYTGNGNLAYSGTGSAEKDDTRLLNFNPAVRFNGDDFFNSGATIKGLSLRGATKSMFLVNNYTNNVGQGNIWMFFHGDNSSNQRIGFYKIDASGNQFAVEGSGITNASTYTANEPKLLGGFLDQVTGGLAPNGTNPLSMRSNGNSGSTSSLFSNADYDAAGLYFANMNGANLPEAIYYPFALSQIEERKVNTYLAIKYGITLAHDYINTSGIVVFDVAGTTNTGYKNRIFGIGRELAVEGLNQKQSKSQMTSTIGYDFLVTSKGTVATTNALNTGVLADNDYLLLGDNAGALVAQSTEIPTTFANTAGCNVARIGREWKAQVTGAPGAITVVAGSTTSGSYVFPNNAAGVTLLVDTDGNGDFTDGTVNTFPATSVTSGVATFDNVSIPNGAVITIAWTVISPGGVSAGLKLWSKADDTSLVTGNINTWNDYVSGNNLTRVGSTITKEDNVFNYNPAVRFFDGDNTYFQSSSSLGMNGDNTYSEFYLLRGTFTSGIAFDEIITLGGGVHRWENSAVGLNNGSYGAYGQGTAQNSAAAGPTMANLGLYSNNATGTQALLRTNGIIRATNNTTSNLSLSGNFRIGTDVDGGDGNFNGFYVPELIVYNTNLSTTDIQKVNSYLGIKYSIPLGDGLGTSASDYLASDGTVIWTGNSTYKFGMFGIGRDDCSGLVQKQSKTYIDGTDNVKFGLTKLATTNTANVGTFATNKQFIVVGNDGGSFAGTTDNIPGNYLSLSCNPYRYTRNWKVQNTNNTTNALQIAIGDATNRIGSNWSNVTLAINSAGDATFASGTTTLVAASNITAGVATFDNVTLPDGAVFTVCYTLGFPGGVSKPTGIGIVAPVSGFTTSNVNGLAYKLYKTNTTSGTGISTGFSSFSPVLLSSGYFPNTNSFHNFPFNKLVQDYGAADGYGVELTGKLFIPTGSSTYRFRGAADDQLALIIDGTTVLNITSTSTGTNSSNVNLSAGYHDIIIRGRELTGAQNFDLTWNAGSGTSFVVIPDTNFFTQAQGPSAWYAADDNILSSDFANGATVSTWNDISGNANTLTTAASNNPTYYSTTVTQLRNFNPVIAFTNDRMRNFNYLNGFAFGKQGKSVFAVADMFASNASENLTGYGQDETTDRDFMLFKTPSDVLSLRGWGNDLSGFTYGATRRTDILSGIYANGNITTTSNGAIYANGLLTSDPLSSTRTTWDTWMNDQSQLEIGNAPDRVDANGWDGSYSEVIYYPWNLTVTERQKVNSYLAIKWGTTLDQTAPTSYIASDGVTKMWDASLNTAFKYDITGIGRDDCGNLNQRQSTSTDGEDIVAMSTGTFQTTNALNTGNFAVNNSFLTWSHNNLSLGFSSVVSTQLPAALSTTTCYDRFARVWQAQVVGTPGAVTVKMGKAGLVTINASLFKPVLLVGNSPTDFTNATIYNYTSNSNGEVFYDNVTFTHGQYFTLAFIQAAPGGVKTNMTTWFNVDYDVFTDVAQTTRAVNDGDVVRSINNMKTGAAFANVQEVVAGANPLYKPGQFNYNTGVLFDGINDVLATSGNITTLDYRSINQMTSVFTGLDSGNNTQNVYWYHDANGSGRKTTLERNQAFWSDNNTNPLTRNPAVTKPEIYSFANTAGGSWRLYSNLATVGSGTTGNSNATNESGRFRIGSFSFGNTGTNAGRFNFGEFVIYSDDKGASTSYDMRRIHSYMATKYGFTLDQTAMGGQYIASDGTVTYNHTSHWNRITGIGMDDCSAFEQRQSFSQETGGLVKISNDPNGLAATNFANPAKFTTNLTFLLFGDNNGDVTWTDQDAITYNLQNYVRLDRTFRVKETGTVGSVYLEVPDNSSSLTTKLPTEDTSVYLLVSSTNDFTSPTAVVEMLLSGTNWNTNYNFTDGDYFTFATKTTCIAPGGISSGLTSWYKMSSQALGATVTLNDNSSNGFNMTRVTSSAPVPAQNITSGTSTLFNYNRYLPANGAIYYESDALNETSVYSVNAGTTFGVGNGTNKDLFGFGRISNPFNRTGLAANSSFFNNATNNYPSSSSLPNILVANTAPGTTDATKNHATWNNGILGSSVVLTAANLPPAVSYRLRFASMTPVTTGNLATYGLAEAFTYNRSLSNVEVQKINTYLAIKYGQTLAHNYFAPGYDGTNAATETLYDISTYGNRVFGVGRHIAGCLTQNQSTSMLSGSMIKISVDGEMLDENSQDVTPWGTEDRTYVVLGDNNGDLTWNTTNLPALLSRNTCASKVDRTWKVVTTKQAPELYISIPGSTSIATTKLPAIPADNFLYMVVNDNADFTVNANQQQYAMTLNGSGDWELSGLTLDANSTKYIMFVYKPLLCGLPCFPVNPSTSRIRR
ncbi:PA14 domain-containing protein [Flavobacterium dankookense]|uniref:PA14 domain-containing protein n=1 Tax=Flavobacterium dankookense TaxID=706186 RepID=A0A4V3CSM3_9FLAO|nr:PA14 domain-containing protein [Flavobacterium dankookense]TDP61142.1 PA14 domain-containing protein [Flavobacterium dankookense]